MKTTKLCAHGTPGFGLESGKSYAVKDPCKNEALTGHIYCEKCRVSTGGARRSRVSLPTQTTHPKE